MRLLKPRYIIIAALVLLTAGLAAIAVQNLMPRTGLQNGSGKGGQAGGIKDIKTVASELEVPWKVVVLPDSTILATERPGRLRRISPEPRSFTVAAALRGGEGGLLGMAVHPQFTDNGWLYLYITEQHGSTMTNRIERYRYTSDGLKDKITIIDGIPGAPNHDGGALEFGPDGLLYVTTGDAENEQSAQDKGALSGKILRLTDSGGIPADNPFGSPVYSYGHRNPQGMAWDSQGRLWATEHGRSGRLSGYDELNLIKKGANYGWPVIQGDESRPGMERPIAHSGPHETWAPSGLAYKGGALYFAGLRGSALYKAELQPDNGVRITRHLHKQYGRLRSVTAVSGNSLLVTTSNRDGRGEPASDDDKIIHVIF